MRAWLVAIVFAIVTPATGAPMVVGRGDAPTPRGVELYRGSIAVDEAIDWRCDDPLAADVAVELLIERYAPPETRTVVLFGDESGLLLPLLGDGNAAVWSEEIEGSALRDPHAVRFDLVPGEDGLRGSARYLRAFDGCEIRRGRLHVRRVADDDEARRADVRARSLYRVTEFRYADGATQRRLDSACPPPNVPFAQRVLYVAILDKAGARNAALALRHTFAGERPARWAP